jgi:metal-sulfur cluster biosynthetic enzyme
MTYTTPACPDGELMQQMIINQLQWSLPTYETIIVLTFEPMWTIKNIKDEDLQRMFM